MATMKAKVSYGLSVVLVIAGVVAMLVLRARGIRFLGPVPTLALYMVPMGAGIWSLALTAPRRPAKILIAVVATGCLLMALKVAADPDPALDRPVFER